MQDNRARLVIAFLLLAVFVLFATIIAIADGPVTAAATGDSDVVRTEAVSTYSAALTATALRVSTSTFTMLATQSLSATGTALSGRPNCLGLRFLRDVTVPDNTEMTPAEVFTKSWLVSNSGTCPWRSGFQVVLIGGLAMGGSPFRLAQNVGPGGEIQVSIKMVAPPNQMGVVQGTWMMTDDQGQHFGDYLSVVIVVAGPTRLPGPTSLPILTP